MRLLLGLSILGLLAAVAGLALGLANARADPVVRRASIDLAGWPADAAPVRAVLISDIHFGGPAMTRARLVRIVRQIDALSPDLVLIAGDFVDGHDPGSAGAIAAPMVEPLSHLGAPLGVVAVPGNHDHWTGLEAVAEQLARAGVTLLRNEAIVRGPLAIGGVDDEFSGHDDLAATLAALRPLPGARLLLTHSPDIAPALPRETPLLLAGTPIADGRYCRSSDRYRT